MIKKITSPTNFDIKQIIKLRKDKKFRKINKKALIVGKNTLNDLKKTQTIDTLIVTDLSEIKDFKAKKILLVTEKIMKKITNVESPEKIAAILEIPNLKIEKKNMILILDNISNPQNMGAIIRCALAFNFDLVICTTNSADPFSEKALRASKGSTFSIPIITLPTSAIKSFIQKNNLHPYIADLKGANIKKIKFQKPLALILSNEAKGPSLWTKKIAKKINIEINKSINSLNVAVAAGIFMYLMNK